MNKKEKFLDEILRINTLLNKVPTAAEYNRHTILPKGKIDTLVRLFGSYSTAIKEAGLTPTKDFSNKGSSLVQCLKCNIKFKKNNSEIIKSNSHFCSRTCSVSFNNNLNPKRIKAIKEIKLPAYDKYITEWKLGLQTGIVANSTSRHIRRYLLLKYNNQCTKCGWNKINPFTNKTPLELEHVDGNYKNNLESNLTILCPSCHALTATYKGANKGNGTRIRK